MSGRRTPVTITLQPWFQDHCFGGKVVFPAVETMILLAAWITKIHPQVDIRVMEDVSFAKFFEIPSGAATVEALFECETGTDDRLQAKLLSRTQFNSMSRIKEHGEIFFPPVRAESHVIPDVDPTSPANPAAEIKVEQLYRDLVPFGPNYHTLQETLYLSKLEAWGILKAPEIPVVDPVQEIIGSPFPLDGALHAACVLGQQSVDFVPFPVGFDRRKINRPTQPGSFYLTRVRQISRMRSELIFDLDIFDGDGRVYENITGVRMRDVSKAI